MKISDYWENNYYKHRFDWAFNARKKFLSELKNEISLNAFKINDDEVIVSLFGSSGVGKTTLLLKLLGINDIHYDKIANLLRCGQSIGHASTPTAFVYKLNNDDFYSINNNQYTEDEFKTNLIKIRKDVENGTFKNTKEPVTISLPKIFFNITDDKFLSLKIVDLPGYGSSNSKEQTHVREIISNYIGISNLILLIEKADSISSFYRINHPSLRYWKENTIKFRLITTFSISPSSQKEKLKNIDKIDKKDFVELYRKEFVDTAFNGELPSEFKLYPLEYGHSWFSKDLDNNFKSKYTPIINDLIKDLRDEIISSTDEYSQFIITAKHLNYIKSALAIEEKKLDNMINNKNEIIDDLNEQDREYCNLIDYNKKKLNELTLQNIKTFDIDINSFILSNEPKEYKQDLFVDYIEKFKEHVISEFKNFKNEINTNQFQSNVVKNTDIKKLIDKKCNPLRNEIAGFFFGVINGEYHLGRIHDLFKECLTEIEDKINFTLFEEIKIYNEKISKKRKYLIFSIIDKEKIKEIKNKIDETNNELKKIREEKEKIRKDFEHDLNICKKFYEILNEFFIKEYNKSNLVLTKINQINKIYNISYLFLISNEYKKILRKYYEQ